MPSFLEQLTPKTRIIALLIITVGTLASSSIANLLLMFSVALALTVLSKPPLARTIKQLLAMDGFIILMLFLLPFTIEGTPAFHIGDWAASQEGLMRVLDIALKANTIMLSVLALIANLNTIAFGHALAQLHVPDKLVLLLLFTVRYIDVIQSEYQRMRQAMKVRAFHPGTNMHTWRSYGYLVGMLLVRSMERAENIVDAMKCRGFNGNYHLIHDTHLGRADYWFLGLFTLLVAGIALLGLI